MILPPAPTTRPTLIADAGPNSEVVRDEIFGPVLAVLPFDTDDEAIALANDTPYGLAASAWTRDVYRALRATREIRAGCVWVNDHIPIISEMPHGGMKESGFGKDMSTYSFEDYTVVKHVMFDLTGRRGQAVAPDDLRRPERSDQGADRRSRPALRRPGLPGHRRGRRHRRRPSRAGSPPRAPWCRSRTATRTPAPGWSRTSCWPAAGPSRGRSTSPTPPPAPPRCDDVVDEHGRLDVLVNNAGVNRRGALLDLAAEDWSATFAVNVDAIVHLCRAVLPVMITAGQGAIVNTASQWGLSPAPGHVAYNTSKAAVVALTQNLARDYAPAGVRVNAVCPGEVWTPMLEANLARSGRTKADLDALVPYGRVGMPEEIAALVAFLASDEAPYLCGAAVEITGAQAVA